MEVNRNIAAERARLMVVKNRVRSLADNHAWIAEGLRAAPESFLELQRRCEHEGPRRKRQLARPVLAQGRLTDPQVTDCTPTLRVRIDSLCPVALATELQKFQKGASLPEALEQASAAAALAALDRASKYWDSGLSREQLAAMEAEDQALLAAATHVQYCWSLNVARPSDWKEPANPNSLSPVDLRQFDGADFLTIAQFWLGALADAGESRPIVREPGATGDFETDFRNCMLEKTRSGTSTESPQEVPLNLAEQLLEEIEKWAKSEAAARGETLTAAGNGVLRREIENSSGESGEGGSGVQQTKVAQPAPDAIDEYDAAILAFLNRSPSLRRKVSDVLPDTGPQDRKAIAKRLRKLADRTPPLVDYPKDERSGVAILPAGVEALKRATEPTPR
ncbi:MAG: hypothetical protein KF859_10965 [Phycisphaeraceae bacterium]|nr:hypothetical protein [Phycisphaeraceae bacterium]